MSSADGPERGEKPKEGQRPGWVFPESEGAVCRWHTPSADRAEGETAARREQAKRDNKAVQGYVTFLPVHMIDIMSREIPGV